MQTWPFTDIAYLNVEHFRSRHSAAQKWEHRTVEAVFVSETTVQFFDHNLKEYKNKRNELDEYLQRLSVDSWKLTYAGSMVNGKGYQFRRYHFQRATS